MTDVVALIFGDNPPLVIWILVGMAAMGVWVRSIVSSEGGETRKVLYERFQAQELVLTRLDERSKKGN